MADNPDLETLVRPFLPSSSGVSNTRTSPDGTYYGTSTNPVPASTTEPDPTASKLTWKASQPTGVITLQALGITVSWPDDDAGDSLQEDDRVTEVKRITQEDNPDNWVDVEYIKQVRFIDHYRINHHFKLNN